jgi:hypothetical protein
MSQFRDCLDDCGFVDLGFTGPKFTWNNRQDEEHHVKVRLDRAVANSAFTDLFQDVWVENVITTASDHLAISISLADPNGSNKRPVQQGFRFEAAWLRAPDYRETMEKAWAEGVTGADSLHSTWSTLHSVATSLKKWGRDSFGAIKTKINRLEQKVKAMHFGTEDGTPAEICLIEKDLCELFEQEEVMARQRSRVEWLNGNVQIKLSIWSERMVRGVNI